MDDQVCELAREAGIAVDWTDAAGQRQRVAIDSLRTILGALGYPCTSQSQISESRERLRETSSGSRSFFTATVGEPIAIGAQTLTAIDEPGYHRVDLDGREITIAVAPPRCLTLNDIAPG